jgi:drug/metabolite transporter (DMT)-like permease
MARMTTKLDSRHDLPKTWTFFLTTILPIGIVSSGSLVCSNLVYLHLSVALIQMLKAASPFTVLLVQWMFGLANPTRTQIINILIIVFGVAIASAGTLEFSFIGFFFQLGGLGFEAVRVVLIEVLLSRQGLKMDAMTGLYYSAPVVAVLNLLSAAIIELPHFNMADLHRVGFLVLLLNAAVAFTLSFTSMVLVSLITKEDMSIRANLIQIGKTSSLVMSLSGIFKSLLLIGCSVIIWHTILTPVQLLGYTITLLALIYYSLGWEKLLAGYHAVSNWAFQDWSLPLKGKLGTGAGISPQAEMVLWIGYAVFCICVVTFALYVGH